MVRVPLMVGVGDLKGPFQPNDSMIYLTAHFIFNPEAWVRSGKTQAVIRNSLALTWLFSLAPCVALDAELQQFFKTAS